MSLRLVPFKSLGVVSYSPFIVAMAVSVAVCEIFSVKEWRDLENQVRGRSRSLVEGLGENQDGSSFMTSSYDVIRKVNLYKKLTSK